MEREKKFSSWFPGHMKKARYLISENLKNVDIVFELLDARAVKATRNKSIKDITKNKLKLIILAKSDLADQFSTKLWEKKLGEEKNTAVVSINCKNIKKTKNIINKSFEILKEFAKKKGKKNYMSDRFRAMVVGVPNVGKSTLINSLAERKKARTGNFPGVTVSEQWVDVGGSVSLLDTPGNLNFEDKEKENGFILELLGSIKSGNFDEEEVAFNLVEFFKKNHPEKLEKFLQCEIFDSSNLIIERFGRMKGMLKKGSEVDMKRTSEFLIKAFREGQIGRVTLQLP